MCDRSFVLILFLIIKIIFLVIAPLTVYFLYKKNIKEFSIVGIIDIFFIGLFIVLKLIGNPCATNSTFSYIKNNVNGTNIMRENADTLYETIRSTSKYRNSSNKNVYFYGINYAPLKNHKLSCNKNSYIKNYGNGVTAITTLISNTYGSEVNEVNVLSYLEENKLIDCENGIDFDSALNALSNKYKYNYYQINRSQVDQYIYNGKSVLVETKNNSDEKNNFGCEKDYIIIYNKNNDGNYNIINSNDKNYSYFCPSNTIGYGSIIEKNQNNRTYTLDEIDSKAVRYYVIEVR